MGREAGCIDYPKTKIEKMGIAGYAPSIPTFIAVDSLDGRIGRWVTLVAKPSLLDGIRWHASFAPLRVRSIEISDAMMLIDCHGLIRDVEAFLAFGWQKLPARDVRRLRPT